MKKLSIFILIALATPGSILLGKESKYTKQLNNKISGNCQNVRAAWFVKGDLECACDHVEEYLKSKDLEAQPNPQSHGEAIMTGGYLFAVAEHIALQNAVRTILIDEPDDVKWKNFNELRDLTSKLKDNYKERQATEKKREAAKQEQAKNRF